MCPGPLSIYFRGDSRSGRKMFPKRLPSRKGHRRSSKAGRGVKDDLFYETSDSETYDYLHESAFLDLCAVPYGTDEDEAKCHSEPRRRRPTVAGKHGSQSEIADGELGISIIKCRIPFKTSEEGGGEEKDTVTVNRQLEEIKPALCAMGVRNDDLTEAIETLRNVQLGGSAQTSNPQMTWPRETPDASAYSLSRREPTHHGRRMIHPTRTVDLVGPRHSNEYGRPQRFENDHSPLSSPKQNRRFRNAVKNHILPQLRNERLRRLKETMEHPTRVVDVARPREAKLCRPKEYGYQSFESDLSPLTSPRENRQFRNSAKKHFLPQLFNERLQRQGEKELDYDSGCSSRSTISDEWRNGRLTQRYPVTKRRPSSPHSGYGSSVKSSASSQTPNSGSGSPLPPLRLRGAPHPRRNNILPPIHPRPPPQPAAESGKRRPWQRQPAAEIDEVVIQKFTSGRRAGPNLLDRADDIDESNAPWLRRTLPPIAKQATAEVEPRQTYTYNPRQSAAVPRGDSPKTSRRTLPF